MEDLVKMAEQLGQKMAQNDRAKLLWEAQKAVNEDQDALKLLENYQKIAEKIQNLERQQQPIEVEDKRALREAEEKISMNEKLKELTRRQVDFVEMTHKVKKAIDDQLRPD